MSRRRTVHLSLAGIALLFLALPYIVWHPRQLNHDGFAKIELGMTQQEVEQLLGCPPGIYYPAHPGGGGTLTMEGYDVPDAAEFVRCDDKKRYEVWFNDQGIVSAGSRGAKPRAPASSSRYHGTEPRGGTGQARETIPPQ